MPRLSKSGLRAILETEIEAAGWRMTAEGYKPPALIEKEQIRLSSASQRTERAERERRFVETSGNRLMKHFANGSEIEPKKFQPMLVPVLPDTEYGDVFRIATLLWSIPVSRGYGRRMRYVILDEHNGKLVGILALGDPVFNLKVRDEYIGWSGNERASRLYNILDAYVLGAVPPYNELLCGKFIALAALSNEVRSDFHKKYRSSVPVIGGSSKSASLVLITTTSSLGRSSIYNRLRFPDEVDPMYFSVGYSGGWGHFHISDAAFSSIRKWLRQENDSYADGHGYGDGPNWRMRAIRQAFDSLGFTGQLLRHGVRREVFLAPTARNFAQYLRGETSVPRYYDRPFSSLSNRFKERWMLARSSRITDWRCWERRQTWKLITQSLRGIE